jgi:hypothetical protein
VEEVAGGELDPPRQLADDQRQDEDVVRREDPERAAQIEPPDVDPARGGHLRQEEIRDQEARDYEEDAHAELAQREMLVGLQRQEEARSAQQVTEQDEPDRDRSESVERGDPFGRRHGPFERTGAGLRPESGERPTWPWKKP